MVVANTTPICYLVLIGEVHLLPSLYREVAVPRAVLAELSDPRSPAVIRAWANRLPAWLAVIDVDATEDLARHNLDPGELAAIALARQLRADLIIIDDAAARSVAARLGLQVTGTLGVLLQAHRRGSTSLRSSIVKLRATNFYLNESTLAELSAVSGIGLDELTG